MVDPVKLFDGIHTHVTGELMQLMDGFYHNIEDGLFELAYANPDQAHQRHVVELMRELRFRRDHLLKTFGKRMGQAGQGWYRELLSGKDHKEEYRQARELAAKSSAHFGPVLRTIAERVGHATSRDVDRRTLPISPEQISLHFVMSCRSVKFDHYSINTVQDLFGRFVLDRMGASYGRINADLSHAGLCSKEELQELTVLSSSA